MVPGFKTPQSDNEALAAESPVGELSHVDREEDNIIFSGLMDKPVNIDACIFFYNEIFPKILKRKPNIKFYIVGPNPSYKIKRLKNNNVSIIGAVDDIRRYLRKAGLIVCPLRIGSGTRNKVLQAMALGKSVVSTTIGAEGIEVTSGKDIIIADRPEEFAENVL